MNDLRERANYDPEAHAPDERTQYDLPTVKAAPNYIWVQVPIDGQLIWTTVEVPAKGVTVRFDARGLVERVDELNARMDALRADLRELSERMQEAAHG